MTDAEDSGGSQMWGDLAMYVCVTDWMTTYVTDNMTTYVTYLGIILVYNLVVVWAPLVRVTVFTVGIVYRIVKWLWGGDRRIGEFFIMYAELSVIYPPKLPYLGTLHFWGHYEGGPP